MVDGCEVGLCGGGGGWGEAGGLLTINP
jgi:hypothetical protein